MSDLEEKVNTQITKAEFDKLYEESLTETEELLYQQMEKLKSIQDTYLALLDFRRTYRKEYKTHHIKHMFDFTNRILTYVPQEKRKIGYILNKPKNDKKEN